MSRRRQVAAAVLVLTAALSVWLRPVPAWGSDIAIAVAHPHNVAVGDEVEVLALVTTGRVPTAGAVVSLTFRSSFAGVEGDVELDRAVTGPDGIAALTYVQRAADNGEMQVVYLGPEDVEVEPFVIAISVLPGAQQQFRVHSGVSIWWLRDGKPAILLIAGLWALIAYAAIHLVLVARAADNPQPARKRSRDASGSALVAAVLAAATVVTAVGMVVVFLRNPLTHQNLAGHSKYDRTEIATIGVNDPFVGPGLHDAELADSDSPLHNGAALFFQYGCATCHGLGGRGAVVGPELLSELAPLPRFVSDVREGPDTMPGFAADVLGDAELDKIHHYLEVEAQN